MGKALLLSGLNWHLYDLCGATCVLVRLLVFFKKLKGTSSIPLNGCVYSTALLLLYSLDGQNCVVRSVLTTESTV